MSDHEGKITLGKVTVGLTTGAGGKAAQSAAEGLHLPTTAELIGWLTVGLLLLQIGFLIADRIIARRKRRRDAGMV